MDDRDIDNGLEGEGEVHDASGTHVDVDLDADQDVDVDIDEDAPADFDALDALSEDEMDNLVDDGEAIDDDEVTKIDAALELSPKEQNARTLAIRRAIEERAEKRLLEESLEELDMDLDDI